MWLTLKQADTEAKIKRKVKSSRKLTKISKRNTKINKTLAKTKISKITQVTEAAKG